jgi:hypothetical protein
LHHNEFIELVKATVEAWGFTPRVCSHLFGDADIVTSDLEFETHADREAFMAGFDDSQPEYVEFLKRYPDLAETGMTRDLLRVR